MAPEGVAIAVREKERPFSITLFSPYDTCAMAFPETSKVRTFALLETKVILGTPERVQYMLVPLRKVVSSNGHPGGEYSVDCAHSSRDAVTALRTLFVSRPLATVFVVVGVGEAEGVSVGVGVGEEVAICVVEVVGVASCVGVDEKKSLPALNPLLI